MIVKYLLHSLGVIAWTNERLSRQSVNFIPANWIVFTALGVALMTGFPELWDAWLNGTPTSLGNPWILATIEGILLISLILFLVTFCTHYIVFRKNTDDILSACYAVPVGSTPNVATPDAPSPKSNLENIGDVHVTGKFVLDAQTGQRFLNIPVTMQIVESGDIAFLARINASTTMYETIVLKERIGIWYMMMKRTGCVIEPGRLYLGIAALPALRVRYTNAITSLPDTMILSFKTEPERQNLAEVLSQCLLEDAQ